MQRNEELAGAVADPGPCTVNSPDAMRAASSAWRRRCSSRAGSEPPLPPAPSPPPEEAAQRSNKRRRQAAGGRRRWPWAEEPEAGRRNGDERPVALAAAGMAGVVAARQWCSDMESAAQAAGVEARFAARWWG